MNKTPTRRQDTRQNTIQDNRRRPSGPPICPKTGQVCKYPAYAPGFVCKEGFVCALWPGLRADQK